MSGYENDVLETLSNEFYQFLGTAEQYCALIQRNVDASSASNHPKRQQQLVLLGNQLKAANALVSQLRGPVVDSVIKMVDGAGGPWNQKQFLDESDEYVQKTAHMNK